MSANGPARTGGRCGTCSHFIAAQAAIEAAIPTLAILGSAYASVAWDDGLCRQWDALRSPRDTCDAYRHDAAASKGEAETLNP